MFGKEQPQLWVPPGAAGLRGMAAIPTSVPSLGDKPQICKYFVNGGCLRGDQCQFLHELPDERHLDVNGVGFIFNSNVHNAQAKPVAAVPTSLGSTIARKLGGGGIAASLNVVSGPVKPRVIPRYRPPEPFLEFNLPPALALPFQTNSNASDVAQSFYKVMMQP